MTPQQFFGLGLRIFAIWLAVFSVRNLLSIPPAIEVAGLGHRAWLYVVPISCAALAVAIWLFPMWTANKLLPGKKSEESLSLAPIEAARIGCALVGLWFFSQGFLDTVWYLLRALYISGNQSAIGSLDANARLEFAIAATTLGFGIALILKADTFARIVAATKVAEQDAERTKQVDRGQ
ncbi:MAG: hypothetical protein ING66_08060 [Rhodocyclaceae bacterium]|jgi:hypothetical protein|nr:hypothetical protein [Rhodocyclaceae bacterium]MCA3059695.1 hypothetical protein [Rhodocyclaceae bacterium]MCA3084027.1 hypothetical protein [Rhodocyclaceae bacterium]